MINYDLKINCDGGARGNPGPAASAFVVMDRLGRLLKSDARIIGYATNNVAEYTAVCMALEWLVKTHNKEVAVVFFLDSELVVKQLTGVYRVKNENLERIVFKIRELERNFIGSIQYQHVRREQNREADLLVNLALDGKWPLE